MYTYTYIYIYIFTYMYIHIFVCIKCVCLWGYNLLPNDNNSYYGCTLAFTNKPLFKLWF